MAARALQNKGSPKAGKKEGLRELASRCFPERWRMRNAFVYGSRKKAIHAKFLKI